MIKSFLYFMFYIFVEFDTFNISLFAFSPTMYVICAIYFLID